MESTSYVISSRIMVFFYLVTTGWIFDTSLCENSFIHSVVYLTNIALLKSYPEGDKSYYY